MGFRLGPGLGLGLGTAWNGIAVGGWERGENGDKTEAGAGNRIVVGYRLIRFRDVGIVVIDGDEAVRDEFGDGLGIVCWGCKWACG